MTDLTEVLTPEEYDTLVALKEKADRLIKDRYADYIRATKGYGPKRAGDITSIEYKGRVRDDRDPSGRYDVIVSYPDPYSDTGSTSDAYLPSALLWDPAGATGKTIEAIEAERAELARIAAAAEAAQAAEAERYQRKQLKHLAKRFGYRLEQEHTGQHDLETCGECRVAVGMAEDQD